MHDSDDDDTRALIAIVHAKWKSLCHCAPRVPMHDCIQLWLLRDSERIWPKLHPETRHQGLAFAIRTTSQPLAGRQQLPGVPEAARSQAIPDIRDDLICRPARIAIKLIGIQTLIKHGSLRVGKRQSALISRDAIPQLFDEIEPLRDGEFT